MGKANPHPDCPRRRDYLAVPHGRATTGRLYVRGPESGPWVGVGWVCRRCGAVKMDDWREWVILGTVRGRQ